jgi:hypothetical protein
LLPLDDRISPSGNIADHPAMADLMMDMVVVDDALEARRPSRFTATIAAMIANLILPHIGRTIALYRVS